MRPTLTRASGATRKQPSAERSLRPFRRTVVGTTSVGLPFGGVERAVQVCLVDLVQTALPHPGAPKHELAALICTRRWSGVGVPVDIAVRRVTRPRPGLVASLRWRARRTTGLFPVMEADLVARPGSGASTERALEGSYHPPFGIVGLMGDAVVGRHVARSTAAPLVAGIGRALEDAARERCHGTFRTDRTRWAV